MRDNRRWQFIRVVERRNSAVMSQGPDELLLWVVCSTLSQSEMQKRKGAPRRSRKEVSLYGWFGFRSPKVLKHSCPEVSVCEAVWELGWHRGLRFQSSEA